MSIINKNDILKVLISYNPWWKTNEVPTDTIKDIVSNEDIGYIKDYGKSLEVGQKINELDMYDSKNGACLYSDGRLIFFMVFNDLSQMTKFFMTFYKYEDKFTGEENPKDGKWHLYFDAHGDPGAGIDDKHIKFNLCYNAKTNKKFRSKFYDAGHYSFSNKRSKMSYSVL